MVKNNITHKNKNNNIRHKKNSITRKKINNYSNKFNKKRTNIVFKNVNTKVPFKNLIIKSDYIQNKKRVFKNIIDVETKITNQEQSGRCWLFAFMNVIRIPMIKKYNLEPDFEFSQNYLFFYDKLEKANYFLNYIYNNKNISIEDNKLIFLLSNLTNDGGQWHMFVNLIEKYGIIPKTNMDDHFHSKQSEALAKFYNNFLRKAAQRIIKSNENKDKLFSEILYECYKILVIFLGEPPKSITWDYKKKGRKNNTHKVVEDISPLDFYKKYVPYNASDKICLINYPCKKKPFYKLYNVELGFNIYGEQEDNFINVPINIIEKAVKKSIDNKEAVWCGVDWGKFTSDEEGFLDQNGFNYKDIFGYNNIMDKCDSLNYRQSYPSHAIVIRGYNFGKGNTNGYLIENSWGEKAGFEGNYYMSQKWFDNYAYYFVVDKKCVSKKELSVLKQKSITLAYNSPFGSLLV